MDLSVIIGIAGVVAGIILSFYVIRFLSKGNDYVDIKVDTATRLARADSYVQLTKKAETIQNKFKDGLMSSEKFDEFLENSLQK